VRQVPHVRKGTQRIYELLDDIASGRARSSTSAAARSWPRWCATRPCAGSAAPRPNPVLSTLEYFAEEYRQHIEEKHCDAFVCERLVGAPCATACPVGTEAWRYIAHIQRGELDEAYQVIREANPFPSVCARVCNHPCEDRCRAGRAGGRARRDPDAEALRHGPEHPRCYVPARGAATAWRPWPWSVRGPRGSPPPTTCRCGLPRSRVFEKEYEPGGMLYSAIPGYRLPREVIRAEIDALLDDRITLRCGMVLGREITIDSLLDDGFGAVFVAIGAHESCASVSRRDAGRA
jgi:NADH-quinone oxidoreductase subunit F